MVVVGRGTSDTPNWDDAKNLGENSRKVVQGALGPEMGAWRIRLSLLALRQIIHSDGETVESGPRSQIVPITRDPIEEKSQTRPKKGIGGSTGLDVVCVMLVSRACCSAYVVNTWTLSSVDYGRLTFTVA